MTRRFHSSYTHEVEGRTLAIKVFHLGGHRYVSATTCPDCGNGIEGSDGDPDREASSGTNMEKRFKKHLKDCKPKDNAKRRGNK